MARPRFESGSRASPAKAAKYSQRTAVSDGGALQRPALPRRCPGTPIESSLPAGREQLRPSNFLGHSVQLAREDARGSPGGWAAGRAAFAGAPVFVERMSVGLDVHARLVEGVGPDGLSGEVLKARMGPGVPEILAWIRSPARPGSGGL